jgi:hypothetical protein
MVAAIMVATMAVEFVLVDTRSTLLCELLVLFAK